MPTIFSQKAVRLTLGFQCGSERYQTVSHWGASGDPDWEVPLQDFTDFIENTLMPLWIKVMAGDCYFRGWELHPMVHGKFQSYRRIYDPATYEGIGGADSCPPNSSLLFSGYSGDQAAVVGKRTATSKMFIGPCPEAQQKAGVVSDAFIAGDLNDLRSQLQAGFPGAVSALTWRLLMSRSKVAATSIFIVEQLTARQTEFTQRRRATPVI